MHSIKPLSAAAIIALLALSAPAAAQSTFTFYDQISTGSGTCQAALPSFEGQVRKRPLALQNEGTKAAFVSCAQPQFVYLHEEETVITHWLINHNASDIAISCTGVTIGNVIPVYVTKQVIVEGGSEGLLLWNVSDGGKHWATSCNLPPGTGIGKIYAVGALVD